MFKKLAAVKFMSLALIAGLASAGSVQAAGALRGAVIGTFTQPWSVDGSLHSSLKGAGAVNPLGKVAASGIITVGMPIGGGAGPNAVSITLSNAKGTVTLTLTAAGPTFPATFQYVVSSATGAFAGLKGKTGTATYKLTASRTIFGGPLPVNSGTFTLTLS
jgi:hypothetical protein